MMPTMGALRFLLLAGALLPPERRGCCCAFSPAAPLSPWAPRPPHVAPPSLSSFSYSNDDAQHHTLRDVLVIGGGIAGLSVAHRIATISGRHVTLLERELPEAQRVKTTAGSFAAAGMLAPQSERLPAGPLLDICLRSREMYGGWVKGVERGARETSLGIVGKKKGRRNYTGGERYLWALHDDEDDEGSSSHLDPWDTGFHSTGGFLAPAFAGDAVATWSPQPNSGKAYWLDHVQVCELEPRLHPDVIGGWWFPEDASVDARRLTCSLRAACAGAGVHMCFGPEWEVRSLEMSRGACVGVHLANGRVYTPKSIVVANGSWMRHLLPLPVSPHKGQSLSLRMPENEPPILSRVLFAQDTYIVPKSDGRIIVGATVEPGRYDGVVTPWGMMHCLSEATRLVPVLGDLPIEETWAGLRPTTPDKCPILGGTEQWDNVYIAGGYWRNGVLLAPKTGQLVGDLVVNNGDVNALSEEDGALLKAFSWERFTTSGGGGELAANARYAATIYPVHKRSTSGVAVSVGTELGFYEGAAAARDDREKDRKAMFSVSGKYEQMLERAAALGVGDAQAFSFVDEGDEWMVRRGKSDNAGAKDVLEVGGAGENVTVEADPNAFTAETIEKVNSTGESEETSESFMSSESGQSDLPSIYEKIRANKATTLGSIQMGEYPGNERADPGFRIYHVDSVTHKTAKVPPFTSLRKFFQMKAKGGFTFKPLEDEPSSRTTASDSDDITMIQSSDEKGNKSSINGFSAIRNAYEEGCTAEATAEATRQVRMRNRIKTSHIDESKIGVMTMPGPLYGSLTTAPSETSSSPDRSTSASSSSADELAFVYDKIKSNKAVAKRNIEMGDIGEESRPKLNFTIYHFDHKTQEVREVPQYTPPGEFLAGIEREKATGLGAGNGTRTLKSSIPNMDVDKDPVANGGSNRVDSNMIESNEKTLDGYQDILSANGASFREEELHRMKDARARNRARASGIMGNLPSL